MVDAQVKLLYNCNFIAAIHRVEFVFDDVDVYDVYCRLIRMIYAIANFQ